MRWDMKSQKKKGEFRVTLNSDPHQLLERTERLTRQALDVQCDNYHFGACRLYLIHFLFTAEDSFGIVHGRECASSSDT